MSTNTNWGQAWKQASLCLPLDWLQWLPIYVIYNMSVILSCNKYWLIDWLIYENSARVQDFRDLTILNSHFSHNCLQALSNHMGRHKSAKNHQEFNPSLTVTTWYKGVKEDHPLLVKSPQLEWDGEHHRALVTHQLQRHGIFLCDCCNCDWKLGIGQSWKCWSWLVETDLEGAGWARKLVGACRRQVTLCSR